jgi:hypothetical protein
MAALSPNRNRLLAAQLATLEQTDERFKHLIARLEKEGSGNILKSEADGLRLRMKVDSLKKSFDADRSDLPLDRFGARPFSRS